MFENPFITIESLIVNKIKFDGLENIKLLFAIM